MNASESLDHKSSGLSPPAPPVSLSDPSREFNTKAEQLSGRPDVQSRSARKKASRAYALSLRPEQKMNGSDGSPASHAFRDVVVADSLAWMRSLCPDGLPPGVGCFTSLPDISELPTMFSIGKDLKVDEYKAWFIDTARLVLSRLPVGASCVFLQSDVRVVRNDVVTHWIDKSYLCSRAAEEESCVMMWHKVVTASTDLACRVPGRPSFSHLVCYQKTRPSQCIVQGDIPAKFEVVGYPPGLFAVPDVFYRGSMIWSRGIGLDCCYVGVRFLRDVAGASMIFDPFCGQGTVLAMANALGMIALGIEISPKRAKKAERLDLSKRLHLVSSVLINMSLVRAREQIKAAKEETERKKAGHSVIDMNIVIDRDIDDVNVSGGLGLGQPDECASDIIPKDVT